MEYGGQLSSVREAEMADHLGQGHPDLVRFDEVRALLARTGLPPEPETYELFYLHVSASDAARPWSNCAPTIAKKISVDSTAYWPPTTSGRRSPNSAEGGGLSTTIGILAVL